MNEADTISYLRRHEIDPAKWDACIESAPNGLIYAHSFYLDIMARHWDALVLGDYEAVLPLTWNKKWGIYYLYQPAFTASLGVFGKSITKNRIHSFLNAIPKKFKLIEIALNSGNEIPLQTKNIIFRKNYVLNLNKPYAELLNAYRENHLRNISKAKQTGCSIRKNIALDEIIQLKREFLSARNREKDADYENFKKLYTHLKSQNSALTYAAVSAKGQLLASCVFFFSHHRAYYILASNHPESKRVGASPFLIDSFIQEHSGQNQVLDFEGSDIHSLAFFYSGFGAQEENYPFLKLNRLPCCIRWIKN